MSPTIEYDVSNVLPFPLERDPEIEGMTPKKRKRRKRKELPPELERYRLYSVDELGEFAPVAWLIDRYLAVGELSVLYGKGDTYKSFVALDWSCELARRGLLVVYIVAEGASGINARIAAWQKHHGVRELPNLRVMPSNVNLHQAREVEAWLEAMRQQLDERHPDLVVTDTLARNFVGGSENDAKDMGLFVEGAQRIRRELETAVLVLHHETKESGTERGTESLRNASFAMFRFVRVNQNAVRMKCDRMKDAEKPPDRNLEPVKVELPELTSEGALVTSLVAAWADSGRGDSDRGAKELLLSRRDAEALRAVDGSKNGARRRGLATALKVSIRTINRDLKPLLERGFLEAEGSTRDRRYRLSARGRKALDRFGTF